jgi:hypothetical protein
MMAAMRSTSSRSAWSNSVTASAGVRSAGSPNWRI